MTRLAVADLRARQSRWAVTSDAEVRLRAAVPAGWTLHVVDAATSADGDGGKTPSDEVVSAIAEAEVYFGFGLPRPLFLASKRLKWVHSAAAGVASLLFPEMLAAPVVITNSAGVHAVPIAEQSLAGILALLRGVDVARELQRHRVWSRETFLGADSPIREVGGLRALILGAGGLGSALGARLSALGVRCTGVRRRPERGVPAGFESVVGPGEWRALLPVTDIVALCAPSTPETRQMLGAAELERLPRGAIIVNVARGALLDENAMARLIRDGALRGAVLDVFSEEPLPESSPLWELPSVIMTPHVSGVTDHFWEREMTLFLVNWKAYDEGKPMRNVVDRKAGY